MNQSGIAILAYPYEGALYWFLSQARHSLDHGYYRSLYGARPEELGVRAAALGCLFEEIVLGSADDVLPDAEKYVVGGTYSHPDLRVISSFDDPEWTEEGRELATRVWQQQLLTEDFS